MTRAAQRETRLHLPWKSGAALLAVLTLAVSCADVPTEPDTRPPSAAVSDAANQGRPGFYFLPPMVKAPAVAGTADGTLSPTVVVCAYDGVRCTEVIAQFSQAGGTGSEAVRFDTKAGHYLVNWHTDRCEKGSCTLDAATTYRIRVFVAAVELGYADLVLVRNGSELKNTRTDEIIALVSGRTLPISFRIETGAVMLAEPGVATQIGTSGGTITTTDGQVTLDFPAKALSSTRAITIEELESTPTGAGDWTPVVDLGPDGAQFATPVLLTLAVNASKLPPGVPMEALAIYTLTNGAWELVSGSTVDAFDNTVSAPLSHFSVYSVLIRPNEIDGSLSPTSLSIGQTTTLGAVVTGFRTLQGSYCEPARRYVRTGWLTGYWEYYSVCYLYETTQYYPAANRVVYWSTHPVTHLAFETQTSVTDATGTATSPAAQALAAGTATAWAFTEGISSNTVTYTITAPSQAITFTTTPPATATIGTRYDVAAQGGPSGNPVTFSSMTSAVCSVLGAKVTVHAAGTCIVAANQAAGGGYDPAPEMTQSFTAVPLTGIRFYTSLAPFTTDAGGPTTLTLVDFSTRDDGSPITAPVTDAFFPSLSLRGAEFVNARSYWNLKLYVGVNAPIRVNLPPGTTTFGADMADFQGGQSGTYEIRLSTGHVFHVNTLPEWKFFGVIAATPVEWVEYRFDGGTMQFDNFRYQRVAPQVFTSRSSWASAAGAGVVTVDFSTRDDGSAITDPGTDAYFASLMLRGIEFVNVRSYWNQSIYQGPNVAMRANLPPGTTRVGADLSPFHAVAGTYTIRASTGVTYTYTHQASGTPWAREFFGLVSTTPIAWIEFSFPETSLVIDDFSYVP